ncbi:MAG: GTPase HflX [Candidatus Neomarinimicrobiota bacterium]|jgi:GTP-binding protein HflX|nr:GTPase HflX [Candidatus Neomarinimicrobiota bacterium]MDD3966326.1 GTPase HflX [Candidatus Neomarinimicrobiota bacterium]MDX9779904.1 GTPase HflX [bacterium]
MEKIIEKGPERAILCAVAPTGKYEESERSLGELARLADTAGIEVLDTFIQVREKNDSVSYFGSGKLNTLQALAKESRADLLLFDDELTSAQQKNIQKQLPDINILDRSALILDIFKIHAKTREAKTQVRLAEAEYLLPRLVRQWTHLERQEGAGRMRGGAGEKQIEIDRRLLRDRIKKLKLDLEKIGTQMETKRKSRSRRFNVALVGYTNAGKSTLMNDLAGPSVEVEDKLFKTLDTTVRRVQLDKTHTIYLSDTVGFIRKLPHQLVASFRSTLKEAQEADLLLKLIDISDPDYPLQIQTIDEVLKEFNIPGERFITVFNKIDLLEDKATLTAIRNLHPEACFISAQRGIGIEKLIAGIRERIDESAFVHQFYVDPADGKLIADLHRHGEILESRFAGEKLLFKVFLDASVYESLKKKYDL